jgi:3-hydroxyisobutyrate dehydrogenase-like beta-hydroxyacid dehydrogenase
MAALDPSVIALLGFGEAGSALARGFAEESGWRHQGSNRTILAVDCALGHGPRGQAMASRAAALGITLTNTYTPALAHAEVVTSTVTGNDAMEAARSALAYLQPGTVFLDFNTITRKTAQEIALLMDARGVQYIDVAVFGSFHAAGYRTPLLLAGKATDLVLPWLTHLGFVVKVLNDRAGDASAVKMLRSIMLKGIEALAVECLVAAQQQDLLDEVLDCFGDIDRATFRGLLDIVLTTHIPHVKRRMEEVQKVNENLLETGIEPLMSAATLHTLRRTFEAGVPTAGVVPPLQEALQLLTEHVVRPHSGTAKR